MTDEEKLSLQVSEQGLCERAWQIAKDKTKMVTGFVELEEFIEEFSPYVRLALRQAQLKLAQSSGLKHNEVQHELVEEVATLKALIKMRERRK